MRHLACLGGSNTFTVDAPTQYITINVLKPSGYGQYFYIHLTNASSNAASSYEWPTCWRYDHTGCYGYDYYYW
jgi:hypothetical protein